MRSREEDKGKAKVETKAKNPAINCDLSFGYAVPNADKYNHIRFKKTFPEINTLLYGQQWRAGEDAVSIGELDERLTSLSDDEVKEIILATFAEAQKQCGQSANHGSTAIVNIVIKKDEKYKIFTASLGDSLAYICQDGQCERLNPKLHNYENTKERERVKRNKGKFLRENINSTFRLNGDLMMTGAFGDTYHDKTGLSHIPFVWVREASSNSLLILASDGLEGGQKNRKIEEQIVSEFAKNPKNPKNIKKLPKELVKNAMKQSGLIDDTDDTTVIVTLLPSQEKNTQLKKTFYTAVFDGHGGDDDFRNPIVSTVSTELSKKFHAILNKEIFKKLLQHEINQTSVCVKSYDLILFCEETGMIVDDKIKMELKTQFIEHFKKLWYDKQNTNFFLVNSDKNTLSQLKTYFQNYTYFKKEMAIDANNKADDKTKFENLRVFNMLYIKYKTLRLIENKYGAFWQSDENKNLLATAKTEINNAKDTKALKNALLEQLDKIKTKYQPRGILSEIWKRLYEYLYNTPLKPETSTRAENIQRLILGASG